MQHALASTHRHDRRRRPTQRHRSWLRLRWLHLLAGAILLVAGTGSLVWSCSTQLPVTAVGDTKVADVKSFAAHKPLDAADAPVSDLAPAHRSGDDPWAVHPPLWPLSLLSLLVSIGWLGHTIVFWAGYIRIIPRRRVYS